MANINEKNLALPLLIEPNQENIFLEEWLKQHLSEINKQLIEYKAILFRGFPEINLDRISKSIFRELLTYDYRSTPRTNLGKNIYTVTEYPKNLSIPQHCENSYQHSWPMKLLFHCIIPASKGGNTPLADMLKVTNLIDPSIKEEFDRKKIKYVRNYKKGVDLSWQEVFGTDDKNVVEKYCSEHNISCEWLGEQLRTSQICDAFSVHPITGQKIWFNQAHLFHISSFEKGYQDALLAMFTEQNLPRNSYFGDGTSIDVAQLFHIRDVFEKNMVQFDWKKDDVLLIDNMLVSHGRTPYEGERKLALCMAEPEYPLKYRQHSIRKSSIEII